jgi:hypothetical protein
MTLCVLLAPNVQLDITAMDLHVTVFLAKYAHLHFYTGHLDVTVVLLIQFAAAGQYVTTLIMFHITYSRGVLLKTVYVLPVGRVQNQVYITSNDVDGGTDMATQSVETALTAPLGTIRSVHV